MSDTPSVLREQLRLCDEAWELLNEENTALKTRGKADEALLARKRSLLAALETSVEALRDLNGKNPLLSVEDNRLIDSAQNRLMKIFLLDRENERLMRERLAQGSTASADNPSTQRLKEAFTRIFPAQLPRQETKPRQPGTTRYMA